MKNIITIQHAQSIQHTNGMIGSWTDWDLTELGIEQAKRIGKRLSQELKNERYVMYSSDLLRAKRTAEIAADFLGTEPKLTNALREFNLGEAVGKSKEWARGQRMPWNTIDDRPYNGAESIREVWSRLSVFYHQIMAEEEKNIIIVSHGGTLGVFHALWLGLEVAMLNQCEFRGGAGSVSLMRENSDGKRIVSRLNDLSYIQ